MTLGTRAINAIKRKRPRLQCRHIDSALRACHFRGVHAFVAINHRENYQPVGQLHRRCHRILQTLFDPRLDQQTVNHHLYRVVLAFIELDLIKSIVAAIETAQLSVDTCACVALLRELFQFLFELALTPAHDRG